MIEVRASASLIFKLPKPELAKAQRALKAWRDANVSTSPKPICKTNETDETKLVLNTRTSNRHAREWVRLRELRESSEICVVHYREVLRYKIYLLIRKKPLSNQFWRLRIKFDWDESLFRAVFSPLGRPTRPTIQPVPASLAMTLDGAWSSCSHAPSPLCTREAAAGFFAIRRFSESQVHIAEWVRRKAHRRPIHFGACGNLHLQICSIAW